MTASGSTEAGAPGTLQADPTSETAARFDADDADYTVGEHFDVEGELVNVEVIFDASSSYVTPQSPDTLWIVDRATAHTQQRPLLLNNVAARGLYVRDCATGQWVNAARTVFAADSQLLQGVFDGEYILGHFYANIETNALLSEQFECQTSPTELTTVTIDGEEQQVQRVGRVEFAYVVEHRQ